MNQTLPEPEFSFVIPLYQTGEGLPKLVSTFRELWIEEPWELILVDDGSTDGTFAQASLLTRDFPAEVTLVELARNFGEHAAVLEGCRRARGRFLVTLDDDLQNPVDEAVRLLRHLRDAGDAAEVVYARYERKQHPVLRNIGSRLVNLAATVLIGKPGDLYLSSFRALRRELVERISSYRGPYPYLDGLILGATRRIQTLAVRHEPRHQGQSNYTPQKLMRLTMSILFDFSIRPLRLAGVLGVLLCLGGALLLGTVLIEALWFGSRQAGWPSIMGVMAIFGGTQLLMLGIIGEYVGRAFLIVSGKPQSLVRTSLNCRPELSATS